MPREPWSLVMALGLLGLVFGLLVAGASRKDAQQDGEDMVQRFRKADA